MVTKRGAAIATGVGLAAAVVTIAGFFIGDIPSFLRSLNDAPAPTPASEQETPRTPGSPSTSPEDASTGGLSPTPIAETVDGLGAPAHLVYLVDLEPVEKYNDGAYDWYEDAISVNGSSYSRAIYDTDVYERSSLTYDLSRDYEQFSATAGILDSSPSGSAVRIEVFVDETLVLTKDAGLGEAVPINIDVTNALRLRIDLLNINPGAVRRPDAGIGEAFVS